MTYHQHCSLQNLFFTILLFSSLCYPTRGAFVSSRLLSPPHYYPFAFLTMKSSSSSTSTQCISSFSNFLSSATPIQPRVVFGNEAGDADSIISSLSLSYVDSEYYNKPITPIISIPRADLNLRTETALLLELVGIQTDKLHYIDDDEVWRSVTELTLVDHNRLTPETLSNDDAIQVVEILDHHQDEGSHENVQGDLRNVAFVENKALVASTCTLVAERLFQSNTKPPYDAQLSLALLGVILLDTVNMEPQAGKGTPRDQAAIDTLLQQTNWSTLLDTTSQSSDFIINTESGTTVDTDKLFHLLSDAKFDSDFWRDLSVTDALRLDYKRFQANGNGQDVFGASSIMMSLDSFLSKDHLVQEIKEYMHQVDVPLLAILGFQFQDGATQRELLLCGNDKILVNAMTSFLLTSPKASVMQAQQVPMNVKEEANGLVMRQFRQGNPKASRKQVAPIMLSFYSS